MSRLVLRIFFWFQLRRTICCVHHTNETWQRIQMTKSINVRSVTNMSWDNFRSLCLTMSSIIWHVLILGAFAGSRPTGMIFSGKIVPVSMMRQHSCHGLNSGIDLQVAGTFVVFSLARSWTWQSCSVPRSGLRAVAGQATGVEMRTVLG